MTKNQITGDNNGVIHNMNRKKTNRLTDGALITGIMVIFSLIGTFVLPIDIIYPLPAIILAKRHDFKISLMAIISAIAITTMIIGVQAGLYYICLYAPISSVMAFLISKDKKPSFVISAGTITFILSFILIIFLMQLIMGVSFTEQMEGVFKETFGLQESIISKFGSIQGDTELLKETYNTLIETIFNIIPAMIIISSLALSALNYLISYKFSRRLKIDIKPLEDFSKFSLPDNFSIGMLIIIVCMLLLRNTNFVNYDILYINMVYLLSMVFFIQGLALVRFLFIKYKVSKGIKILVVISFFLIPIVFTIIIFMGVAEILFDFRKLRRRKIK